MSKANEMGIEIRPIIKKSRQKLKDGKTKKKAAKPPFILLNLNVKDYCSSMRTALITPS
jgi:hypothetical protein